MRFRSREIETQLPAGLDQAVTLAQQNFLALDDDRELRQGTLHVGQVAAQVGQLALDRTR